MCQRGVANHPRAVAIPQMHIILLVVIIIIIIIIIIIFLVLFLSVRKYCTTVNINQPKRLDKSVPGAARQRRRWPVHVPARFWR